MSDPRLDQLDPRIHLKVAAVLSDLAGHGWKPKIAEAYRTVASQRRKKAAGTSTVDWSFHNHTIHGKPAALASDIVDERYLWNIPQDHQFWKDLGSSAKAHGLKWGGDWNRFPDVAHIEYAGLSLAQAKRESS